MTDWIKAQSCGDNACVQVRHIPGGVEIRTNPKDAHPATLFATTEEFDAFLAGVKAGDFDRPTLPAEPDPGAYMIGDVKVLRTNRVEPDHWVFDGRCGYEDWAKVWDLFGGPDVQITPLAPMPLVELPWKLDRVSDIYGRHTTVEAIAHRVLDLVGDQQGDYVVQLTPDQADEKAAALITAARAARDRSGT